MHTCCKVQKISGPPKKVVSREHHQCGSMALREGNSWRNWRRARAVAARATGRPRESKAPMGPNRVPWQRAEQHAECCFGGWSRGNSCGHTVQHNAPCSAGGEPGNQQQLRCPAAPGLGEHGRPTVSWTEKPLRYHNKVLPRSRRTGGFQLCPQLVGLCLHGHAVFPGSPSHCSSWPACDISWLTRWNL